MKYKIIIAMLLSIYIKSQDIYINIDNEDNSNIVPYKENIITAVQNLINNKNDIDFIFNQYTKDSQEKWGEKELARTIYNSGWYKKDPSYYKPTILGVIDIIPEKKYLIKIAYTSRDKGNNNSVQVIYNLIANYNKLEKSILFENYIDWYTKNWYTKKMGNILFFKEEKNKFSIKQAKKFQKKNKYFSKLFNVPVKDIVYYSCKDPIDLYKMKGFDYVPNMFYSRNGGLVYNGGNKKYYGNIIYSANNSEYYPHELAHFYIDDLVIGDKTSRIANEGIATYIGGSSIFPYEHHLKSLYKYIKKNNNYNLIDFLKEDSLVMIDSDTSTLYALGALISKLIFEKKGLDGWKIFLNVPEEDVEKVIIELLGIKKNKLNIYLLEELKKYE